MILLLDIGNTHTHIGLADKKSVVKQTNIPTRSWFDGNAVALLKKLVRTKKIKGAVMCSVVPRVTPLVHKAVRRIWKLGTLELNHRTIRGVGIDYPKPDRSALIVWPTPSRQSFVLARRLSWWTSARRSRLTW